MSLRPSLSCTNRRLSRSSTNAAPGGGTTSSKFMPSHPWAVTRSCYECSLGLLSRYTPDQMLLDQ